jgi:hypothetical protein
MQKEACKSVSQPITHFFFPVPFSKETTHSPIQPDIVSFFDAPNDADDESEPDFVCDVVMDNEEEDVPLIDRRIAHDTILASSLMSPNPLPNHHPPKTYACIRLRIKPIVKVPTNI